MSEGIALQLVTQSVAQILTLSLPLLGVAMIIGLIVSILQATTSIQEQTLTFVPKMVAILLLLMVLAPFFGDSMLDFTRRFFELIGTARL